ncbi:MAG TPA: hypothetical protein PKA63_04255 [Oligoflexia bacterium]|nr:hypothetical protein [Oligoflexia bacterium]HMP47862.1 hypothetical protein [Oligoflexia bacterium]
MSETPRIAIIGSINDPCLLQSSQLIKSFRDFAKVEGFPIDVFSCERNLPKEFEVFNIHRLPALLKQNKYDALIYNLENRKESYVYRWYADQYPGFIILHDASLFRLEIGPLLHGTDPVEIDQKVRNTYGLNAVSVGEQHVLGRSLEIYNEFYPFLYNLSRVSLVFFSYSTYKSGNDSHYECPQYFLDQSPQLSCILSKSVKKNVFSEPERILIYLESPFGTISREINSIEEDIKNNDSFPSMYIYESGCAKRYVPCSIDQLFLDLANISLVIVSSLRPYSRIPAIVELAIERNISVSLQNTDSSFQISENLNSNLYFHNDEATISCILDSVTVSNNKAENAEVSRDKLNLIHLKQNIPSQIYNVLSEYIESSKSALIKSENDRKRKIDEIIQGQLHSFDSLLEFVNKDEETSYYSPEDNELLIEHYLEDFLKAQKDLFISFLIFGLLVFCNYPNGIFV